MSLKCHLYRTKTDLYKAFASSLQKNNVIGPLVRGIQLWEMFPEKFQ